MNYDHGPHHENKATGDIISHCLCQHAVSKIPTTTMATAESGGGDIKDGTKNEQRSVKRQCWKGKFEYRVDYNDHFETPFQAYKDILPLLDGLFLSMTSSEKDGRTIGTSRKDHTLYDPYYCDGRTKRYLHRLGFENVVHEKRDFYKDVEEHRVPHHDTLVTNPPYSDTHKERCIEFCVQQFREHGKCFFLLMPNYVAARSYFRLLLGDSVQDVAYIIPARPYEYDHPEGTGHVVPPFASLWFCGVGRDRIEGLKEIWERDKASTASREGGGPRFVSSLDALVSLGVISMQKRPNPRQRKKRRTMQMEEPSGVANLGGHGTQQTRPPEPSSGPNQPKIHLPHPKTTKGGSRHRDESGTRTKKRF